MKKLAELKPGDRFMYGGVEWVKFEDIGAGTLCLAAEPVFLRAFDEENCNDWRKSSLLPGIEWGVLDALVAEGADGAAFLDWESDLTADDGMTDYGTATDKIALRSDALCRKYREITPPVDEWCWNLTPWNVMTRRNSCNVRNVYSSGAMSRSNAYRGSRGVRPLCYPKSVILVSIPGEDDEEEQAARREEMKLEAVDALMSALNDYPPYLWGDALGAVVAALFRSKQDAEEIAQEEADKRRRRGKPLPAAAKST